MMRTIVLALALSSSAALVCEDLPSCDGCVAKRVDENAPSCKDWGPKKCERKDGKIRWEAKYCPFCRAPPETLPPTAQPTTREPTAGPTASPVANPPTAQIVTCFQESGDCGTCCPACTAVDSLAAAFYGGGFYSNFKPNVATKCICLDLDESGYNYFEYGGIYLTPFSDCARVTGDRNYVYGLEGDDAIYANGVGNDLSGWDGNDAIYANGDGNFLNGGDGDDALYTNGDDNRFFGGDGDDRLAAGGSGNELLGGQGNDACTDLSGSNPYQRSCEDRRKLTDTPQLTHAAAGPKAPAARA